MKSRVYYLNRITRKDGRMIDSRIDGCVSFNEENAIFDMDPCVEAVKEEMIESGSNINEINVLKSKNNRRCCVYSNDSNVTYHFEVKSAMWKG